MRIKDEITKWCRSYVRNELDALCLAEMIDTLFRQHSKTSFAIGFGLGIIFWAILLQWAS